MKAAIVGFGKMGMAIYAVLSLRNHGIEGVIDPFSKDERVSGKEITEEMLKGVDCVIDSLPLNVPWIISKHISIAELLRS